MPDKVVTNTLGSVMGLMQAFTDKVAAPIKTALGMNKGGAPKAPEPPPEDPAP